MQSGEGENNMRHTSTKLSFKPTYCKEAKGKLNQIL